MKRKLRTALYLYILFIIAPHAGAQEAQKCSQSGKDQANTCDEAVKGAVQAESQMSASAAAQSGETINKNSGIAQTAIGAQQQYIDQATQTCESAKKACQQQCETLAAQADVKHAGAAVRAAEKSDCTEAIAAKEGELQANKSPLSDEKKDAGSTGQQSGMQMPQMPSPAAASSGDSSTASPATAAASTCTGSTCSTTTTPATITTGSLGAGGFSDARKKSTGSSSSQTSSKFQSGTVSPTASTTSSTSSGASSGATGSLGSTGGSLSSLPGSGTTVTTPRDEKNNGIGSLAVDGGGGGGSGSNNSGGGDGGLDPSEITRLAKQYGLTPGGKGDNRAPAKVAGSTEVAASFSQGLFSIGDAAINSYCAKKYLQKNCAK